MDMDICERIKTARKAAGITQAELGAAVGVSHAAVSQWENGSSKGLKQENLLKCAKRLGVNVEWLVTGKGERETPTGLTIVDKDDFKGVTYEIDQSALEKALKQLDAELPGWMDLTVRRRARLLMTFYEDIYDAKDEVEAGGDIKSKN